ncbi:MAG: tRNA lysidine(34) synthetase TilS [Pseudomonadota bacterium]
MSVSTMPDQVYQIFCDAMGDATTIARMGLSVSGGGDSMALMYLAHRWSADRGTALRVAVVDHGLRADSAAEAAFVQDRAAALGMEADVLRWTDWSGQGNLQAAARRARRDLVAAWARRQGIGTVALGHTMDDQAETVLMRLGRGAGVDGLSAMAPQSEAAGLRWLRPLLGLRREALRRWLVAGGREWVDDPSNDDPRFDRVRARAALGHLHDLGVTVEGLSATSDRLRDAREALDQGVAALAAQAATWGHCGELRLNLAALRAAPAELARRLLRCGLRSVAGTAYGARAEAEAKLMSAMLGLQLGGGRSLHGCIIRPDGPTSVVVMREVAALDPLPRPFGEAPMLWDGRFRIAPRAPIADARIAPLGEAGLRHLRDVADAGQWAAPPAWRGAPRAAQLTTPALWQRGRLRAAPLADYGDQIDAVFVNCGPNWQEPSHQGT